MPKKPARSQEQLSAENADLRARLDEAEETLRAIRSNEVDALMVSSVSGEQLYTLKGADHSYRILIEDMNEGALTLTREGLILYANRRFAEMLKMPLEKVIGSTIQTWIASENQLVLQSILGQGPDKKRHEQSVLSASDGTKVSVYLSVSKLADSESPYSFGIVATDLTEQKRTDAIEASEKMTRELLAASNQSHLLLLSVIEDQKLAEDKLLNSLIEKEILLKEVHHRVKNNLMTIIGLIKMQETKADIERLNSLLKELEGRIRSMALVHESLHRSENLARIDLQNYIEALIVQIHAQFGAERKIHFSVQAASMGVSMDFAIPCGLILNELITNAYKHAFPGNHAGSGIGQCEIEVVAGNQDGMLELTVADNGVGLPPGLDWEQSETMGLKLIRMLCGQLHGSIALDRTRGTAFHLRFARPAAGS